MSRATQSSQDSRTAPRAASLWSFLEGGNPYTNYVLILGSTLALSAIGLTMVLSTSSVDSTGGDAGSFAMFFRQGGWAIVGLIGMFVMARIPTRWLGSIGWALMIVSSILLALTAFTPLGVEGGGSTNWIRLGPFTGQPSELAKLALVLWGSAVLTRKKHLVQQFTHWVMPLVFPGALAVLVLVLIGGDLGTSLVIIVLVGSLLFTAGVAMRYFLVTAGVALAAVAMLMWITPYRMMRVYAWLGMNCDHVTEPCHQTQQGLYALASGGFWGVGLGQSRQKWAYIPEAENDFIFTILGEELGLLGTLLALSLFAALTLGIYRVAVSTDDLFTRLVCTGTATWLVGQSFINIGMVIGLLPVTGVPLPFISYGGTALTCSLLAVGVILNLARSQRGKPARPPAPVTQLHAQ